MRWDSRPVEIANLLNPAFCALLLRDATRSYCDYDKAGMPYVLAFLLLPLVLHRKTRESVSQRPTTTFGQWIERNSDVMLGFADRSRELNLLTKEAIMFGLQHGVLSIGVTGSIVPADASTGHPPSWHNNSPPQIYVTCARNIGKWFADVGDEATICRLLGVRP